ncbi:MAG: S8 family serine peptidase [Planctomycetes bacterium]|nr:S8 family serine peptidase [Planctomycetota bacterium]
MPILPFSVFLAALPAQTPATPLQGPRPTPLATGVVEAPAAPAAPGAAAELPPRIAVSLDAPPVFAAPLDDRAPRAGAARIEVGADGDRLLAPADEDPHFLSFLAGRHHPPVGERIDPELLATIQPSPLDARPAPVVYAFAMFERRITAERTAELERLGARVLGYHPSNCLKLAIPLAAFEAVAAYPELRWLGAPQRWQKLHPGLAAHSTTAIDGAVELVVNVYESDLDASAEFEPVGTVSQIDGGSLVPAPTGATRPMRVRSNGWQARALADAGVLVGEYDDAVRAFRVTAPLGRIAALAALDFVQFVEPAFERGPLHEESIPMIYSDSTRYFVNGGTSSSVVAGQLDSGFDFAHSDLNHTWAAGWELGGTGGAWNDPCEHGSHVAGTLLGNGATKPERRGNAPGLGWGGAGRFYNVKVSNACTNWSGALSTWFAPFHTPYWDGVNSTPVPHVTNHSWGSSVFNNMGVYIGPYNGTDAEARFLDDEVFSRGQMLVFAAGNDGSGSSTVSVQGAAKNVFTVGSVNDYWTPGVNLPGELSGFSSRGPTGDGRWKPNVVAPGDSILSVDANSGNGYSSKSGTSMAAPHVTGVIAQMLDHLPFLKYAPERAASVLMATAMTKGNQTLTVATETHLDLYGAGRVEAWKANYGTSQMGWSNWGAYLPANSYTYADFTVSPGCTRLVVCLNYSDPQCSAGAGQALVNNLDLSIDVAPFDAAFNTGDYTAQQSALDNTEIRILDNPPAGSWRWKVWPTHAPQGSYYGLTVFAQYGDITPDVTVTVTPAKTYLKPNESTDVTVSVYSPNYLASNVVIESDSHWGSGWVFGGTKYLNDGPSVSLSQFGYYTEALLGDILHGNSRWATFPVYWGSEGQWGFVSTVRGDNVPTASSMGVVTIDGTPPSTPGNLTSTGTPYVWSQNPFLSHFWTASTDNLSGVAGYSMSISQDAPATPDEFVDTTALSSFMQFSSNAYPQYFNVAAVDRCGNVSVPNTYGPFYIDNDWPTTLTGLFSDVPVGGTTCGPISFGWDVAADYTSGLAGYSVMIDHDPQTTPTGSIDSFTESYATTLAPSAEPYYAHVSAVDFAGNVGLEANWGPFWVGAVPFTNFCATKPHSGGGSATISASGCPSYSQGDLHVVAQNVLGQTTGRLLWSLQQNPVAVGARGVFSGSALGTKLCVFQPQQLGLQASGGTGGASDGAFDTVLDGAFFQANGLVPGTTVYVQYLFADAGASGPGGLAKSGQTDALEFQVTP